VHFYCCLSVICTTSKLFTFLTCFKCIKGVGFGYFFWPVPYFSACLLCFQALEKKIAIFLKNELEKLKKILKRENTQYFVQDFTEEMRDIKEAALDMTLYFLRDMNEVEAADALQGKSLTLLGLRCFWGP